MHISNGVRALYPEQVKIPVEIWMEMYRRVDNEAILRYESIIFYRGAFYDNDDNQGDWSESFPLFKPPLSIHWEFLGVENGTMVFTPKIEASYHDGSKIADKWLKEFTAHLGQFGFSDKRITPTSPIVTIPAPPWISDKEPFCVLKSELSEILYPYLEILLSLCK